MFEFVALDHPCLDFAATVAERGTTNREWLAEPADLADWLVRAGLLDRAEVSAEELASALALREAIYQGLVEATSDGRLSRQVELLINQHAAGAPVVPQVSRDLTRWRQGTVASVLADLARDFITVVTSPDASRLRQCGDERCTRFFVDRSRRADRRWCDMKNCGDRAKAAAYRQRRRGRHRESLLT